MSVEIQNHPLDDLIYSWLADIAAENNVKLWKRIIPSTSNDQDHIVYWIHDDTCYDPANHGYIGVTTSSRKRARFLEHKGSNRFPKDFKFVELRRGSAKECYLTEACLRPKANIGWNIAPGGARGNKNGIPRSDDTRRKIGNANKGNKRSDLALRNKSKTRFCSCVLCKEITSAGYLHRDHFACWVKFKKEPNHGKRMH